VKKKSSFKFGDMVVLSLLLLLAGLLTVSSLAIPRGARAIVLVDGKAESVLELDAPAEVRVQGERGETVVRVRDGRVEITESACPHHTCIRMGAISTRGQVLICVPNRVAVRVEGGEEEAGVDGVTG
jgi:hypothetical protein